MESLALEFCVSLALKVPLTTLAEDDPDDADFDPDGVVADRTRVKVVLYQLWSWRLCICLIQCASCFIFSSLPCLKLLFE